jgi:hypothetical protein
MFLNHKKQFPYLAIRNDRHVVGKGAIFWEIVFGLGATAFTQKSPI